MLPAPRPGAGQLPLPLCGSGPRPPPRASSPQLGPDESPGAPAAAVGPPSPLRGVAAPVRKPSSRRGTPSGLMRFPRRRPANLPSPTAAAEDEGRRSHRRGGGRAAAAARRTGHMPHTVAGERINPHIPPSPHRERVAVAPPRRRPAGVPLRPRHRRADHRHLGRQGGVEGACPRQRRGGGRRRSPAGRGRGTSPPHPSGGDEGAPPARDRRRHRRGRGRHPVWVVEDTAPQGRGPPLACPSGRAEVA